MRIRARRRQKLPNSGMGWACIAPTFSQKTGSLSGRVLQPCHGIGYSSSSEVAGAKSGARVPAQISGCALTLRLEQIAEVRKKQIGRKGFEQKVDFQVGVLVLGLFEAADYYDREIGPDLSQLPNEL